MSGVRALVMMLGCVAAVGGWANTSVAQTCSDNSGCPKGYSCEVTGVSGCTATAPAPSTPPEAGGAGGASAGDPGAAGASAQDAGAAPAYDAGTGDAKFAPPPPPDKPVPGCDTQEYRSCVPGKCASDGDCADGMVCHERSIGTCTSAAIPPCAPGAMCPGPSAPVCTETVEHICVPRYLLPCEKAAECGAGFTCEPQLTMVCSGGAAVDAGVAVGGTGGASASGTAGSGAGVSADGGAADRPSMEPGAGQAPAPADAGLPGDGDLIAPPPPMPFECHAEPTQLKYCKPLDKECKTDQDCPTLFSCVTPTFDLPVIPMCVAPADGDGGTCGSFDAGGPTMVARSYCSPRYGEPAIDVASPQSPSVPGSATGAGGKGGTSGGVTPPTGNPGGHEASDAGVPAEDDADDSNHVEACSVATPGASEGSPTWFAALFSLAAAWVVSRRRR